MICGTHISLSGNSTVLRPEFKLKGSVWLISREHIESITYGFDKSLITDLTLTDLSAEIGVGEDPVYKIDVEANTIVPSYEATQKSNGLNHYSHSVAMALQNADTPAVKSMLNVMGLNNYVAIVETTNEVVEAYGLQRGMRVSASGVGDRYGIASLTLSTFSGGNNPALEPFVPATFETRPTFLDTFDEPLDIATVGATIQTGEIGYYQGNLYVAIADDAGTDPTVGYKWIGYYA